MIEALLKIETFEDFELFMNEKKDLSLLNKKKSKEDKISKEEKEKLNEFGNLFIENIELKLNEIILNKNNEFKNILHSLFIYESQLNEIYKIYDFLKIDLKKCDLFELFPLYKIFTPPCRLKIEKEKITYDKQNLISFDCLLENMITEDKNTFVFNRLKARDFLIKDLMSRLKINDFETFISKFELEKIESLIKNFFIFDLEEFLKQIEKCYFIFYSNLNTTQTIKSTGIFPFEKTNNKIEGFITASQLIDNSSNFFYEHEISFNNSANSLYYKAFKFLVSISKEKIELNENMFILLEKICYFSGLSKEEVDSSINNIKKSILCKENNYFKSRKKEDLNLSMILNINDNLNVEEKCKSITLPYKDSFLKINILEPFNLFKIVGSEMNKLFFTKNSVFEEDYFLNRSKFIKGFTHITQNRNIFLTDQYNYIFKGREIKFNLNFIDLHKLIESQNSFNKHINIIEKKYFFKFKIKDTYFKFKRENKDIPSIIKNKINLYKKILESFILNELIFKVESLDIDIELKNEKIVLIKSMIKKYFELTYNEKGFK